MSLTYRLVDRIIRKKDLKRRFDMPEDEFLNFLKTKERPTDLPKFMYKELRVTKTIFEQRPMFRLTRKEGSNGRAVLFLHGGGGMFPPTIFHYKLAQRLAQNSRAEVFFPFYPLAPEATVDESAEWVFKAYDEVLKEYGADKVTVIGDSAGALLAARLVGHTARKPRGVVLISPVTGTDNNDEAYVKAKENDVLLSEFIIGMSAKHWGKDIPLSDGRMNAEYTDFTGYPPTLLFYGTGEMFAPHMDRLIANIKKSGAHIKVYAGKGMCHDWAIISSIPEGRRALKRMCKFVNA